jgi:DNA (cytosine-5)-methyltransferase 1
MTVRDLTAIDLFCGAGGLTEGLRQAGFHVLAGNDFDEAAGVTFERTHREAKFLGGPIQKITASDFLRAARLKPGQLDVLAGGPPCQAYSVYNHQRGMHDERSTLFREYLRLVEGLSPRWVIMENVTGITSAGNGMAFRAIIEGFGSLVAIPSQDQRRPTRRRGRLSYRCQWDSCVGGCRAGP